jgi:hypothetical protein
MKWFQLPLILFLLLGSSPFQYDQFFDSSRLVFENPVVTKIGYDDPVEDEFKFMGGGLDSTPMLSLLNQIGFIFQLKNPLSVFISFFQGTSPFWRAPPSLDPLIFYQV